MEIIERDGQRVDVCKREARLDVRPAAQLWRLLLRWRPDVVHSWDWMSSAAALPLCLALRIPVVDATVRNGIARRRRSLPLRLVHAASARVVANSWAGLDAWGVGTARGRVVYNGFDPERLPLCAPRGSDATGVGAPGAEGADPDEAGERGGGLTVAMTGRMMPHKDFATVIRAARLLADGAAGAEAAPAGEGAARDRRRRSRRRLALALRPARRRSRAAAPRGAGRRPCGPGRRRVRRPRPRGAALPARCRRRRAHVGRAAAPRGLLERHHGVHGVRAAGRVQPRRRQPGAGRRRRDRVTW